MSVGPSSSRRRGHQALCRRQPFYTVKQVLQESRIGGPIHNFLVNSPKREVLGNDRGASASSTARAAGSTNVNDQKVLEYLNSAGPHSSKETAHLPNDTEFNSTLFLIYQRVAFGQISPATGGQQIYDLITRLIKK